MGTKKTKTQAMPGLFEEADGRTRTDDRRITSAMLYQLSYIGA